jgi:hypothetical protein
MSGGFSPIDPLYFLHHTFIDKMWYDWQQAGNKDYPHDKDAELLNLCNQLSASTASVTQSRKRLLERK